MGEQVAEALAIHGTVGGRDEARRRAVELLAQVGLPDPGEAARAYVGGGREGVALWVVHCAQAVALGAREGLAVCEAILRESA